MSAAIGPGSPVIFIGPNEVFIWSCGLTIGAMYFVEGVHPAVCGAPTYTLKGSPGNFTEYCGCRFKPVDEGELSEKEVDFPIEYIKAPEHV